MRKERKGITLIALVVTIIVLIILAGISINLVLGDNGILTMAKKATEEYERVTEEETLKMQLLTMQMNDNTKRIGKPLYDRNLDNSSIWDIIIQNKENITYGTGWNYIEKGTEIEGYGASKYSWVINYETNEMVQLEDSEYTEWNYEKVGTVTDGLLFNLDSANVSFDKSSWGSNTTLYYYDNQTYNTPEKVKKAFEEQKAGKEMVEDSAGYDRQISKDVSDYIDEETNAFKFNGNNYIEYRDKNGTPLDFSKGLTFTFYGNINGKGNTLLDTSAYIPFFSLWSGKFSENSYTRLGYIQTMQENHQGIMFSLYFPNNPPLQESCGTWLYFNEAAPHCQFYGINNGKIMNQDIYLNITFDPTIEGNQVAQSIYLNGEHLDTGYLNRSYYDSFLEYAKTTNYLELGRTQITQNGNWEYLKGLCYSMRIYNKALKSEEIKQNYDSETAFHKYVIDSKKTNN